MPRDSAHLEHQRGKLVARISRRFDTVRREYKFGDLKIDFLQVRNPDQVLDDIVIEADRREKLDGHPPPENELHLPYWAELWDSALGVAQFLAAEQSTIHNPQSTLDLGCGMGLVGTVAAAMGHRVLLADLEADALLFARANAMRYSDVRARRMDWRLDRLGETFELILGADVLYEKSQWEYLSLFWKAHLAPGGSILLGEPGRQTGEMFLEWLAHRREWKLERTEQRVVTREKPIRLFRLFL